MKNVVLLFLSALYISGFAQTAINKSYPAQKKVSFRFDYPELVKISTWDKDEISLQGTVSINSGENDDAFELESSVENGTLFINNRIRDMKNLPHRITVIRDGQKTVFKTKADYQKYTAEHGKDFNMMSNGVDMDITIEIKVPRNTQTFIESVYGMVEVRDFNGPLEVKATYGGVDASLMEKTTGELIAETNYGQIYTNLDIKFGGPSESKNFHTLVSAKPGSGPRYSFESKYGNVYLRKGLN